MSVDVTWIKPLTVWESAYAALEDPKEASRLDYEYDLLQIADSKGVWFKERVFKLINDARLGKDVRYDATQLQADMASHVVGDK